MSQEPLHVTPVLQPESGGAPSRLWLFGGLGIVVVIGGIAAMLAVRTTDGDQPIEETPGPQPVIVERHRGSDNAVTTDEALMKLLDEEYFKRTGMHGSRDDELAWLDREYANELARQNAQASYQSDPDAVYAVDIKPALAAGQVDGPATAPITIVLAYDYVCPYCRRVMTTLDNLRKQFPGKLRVVYMNLIVHPQVRLAHRYSCAAAKQGKFVAFERAWWPKRFDVYASSSPKDPTFFEDKRIIAFGAQLGLNATQLAADAHGSECEKRVADDMAELAVFHVVATPTLFINGKYVAGAQPEDKLKAMIEDRLDEVAKSAVPAAQYYEQEIAGKGLHAFKSAMTPHGPPTRAEALAWLKKRTGQP